MSEFENQVKQLVCERCSGELEYTETTEREGELSRHNRCTECDALGTIILGADGTIIGTDGDTFSLEDGDHLYSGARNERSVEYVEHYSFNPDTKQSVPESQLTYTGDSVNAGWDSDVTYNCSCGFEFQSKAELASHLQAVVMNRGDGAVA